MLVDCTLLPASLLSYFLILKFYTTQDLWTANGVHMVYCTVQDSTNTVQHSTEWEEGEDTDNLEPYGEDYPQELCNEGSSLGNLQDDEIKDLAEAEQGQSFKFNSLKVMRKKGQKIFQKNLQNPPNCNIFPTESLIITGRWINISD